MRQLTITIPELVPGLNGPGGLIREHFRTAAKRKDRYCVLFSTCRKKFPGPVDIVYTRYCTHLMDWDNAAASFKHIGDALVKCGIIKDDKPGIIISFTPRQVKVKTKKEERITILISEK